MRSAQMEQTQNARGSDMLKHSRGIRRDERRPRERTPTRNARQMFQKHRELTSLLSWILLAVMTYSNESKIDISSIPSSALLLRCFCYFPGFTGLLHPERISLVLKSRSNQVHACVEAAAT